ncbi:addiction module antidote protein [Bosea sp. BIWAKO-01]|uniref:addiction module antidote protein n=1 Tax=Bosea sp. BIWAKO-01 TaxID=506668 RepID=UPI000852C576|nr:addiction module antidote protein [Bosea sp. BIWAKO-01]GAU84813.1 hypothetical protein BIWAKO_04752 [Bosea sp. BIWAKO-01]
MGKVSDLPEFDAAEALNTLEAQAEYLTAYLEDGTPAEICEALRTIARARGMTDTAKSAGITREGQYKALGDTGNPEFGTVLAILRGLGFQLSASTERMNPARKKKAV